jgi:hypothetical protein
MTLRWDKLGDWPARHGDRHCVAGLDLPHQLTGVLTQLS